MTDVPIAALQAPADWQTIDFISDLHLHASDSATFGAWQHYLQRTPAEAVFILGDLFDAWIGDDAVSLAPDALLDAPNDRFENRCARVLGEAAGRLALFFMHGNRDFLVGKKAWGIDAVVNPVATSLPDLCNITLLDDPCALTFAGTRWLLSHGDALCLDDVDYLKFRHQVRGDAWQQAFLARPLADRQQIAGELRAQSRQQQARRMRAGEPFFDIDTGAARKWLQGADAAILIHGHTHRPAVHDLGDGLRRIVLSDWDAAASPPRLEVLRLAASAAGEWQRIKLA